MVPDERLAGILLAHPRLRDAGEALIAAANEAGGRDNITVVLLRVEEVQMAGAGGSALPDGPVTLTGIPALPANASVTETPRAISPLEPRRTPLGTPPAARRSRRLRRAGTAAVVAGVLAVLGVGAYVASQSVYFIGTNSRGLVTLFNGFPYELPGGVKLYSKSFVSGVSASTLSPARRRTLLDQTLRSEGDARGLMHSLELGQLE
jgi:PPM family protein phosphatase